MNWRQQAVLCVLWAALGVAVAVAALRLLADGP